MPLCHEGPVGGAGEDEKRQEVQHFADHYYSLVTIPRFLFVMFSQRTTWLDTVRIYTLRALLTKQRS